MVSDRPPQLLPLNPACMLANLWRHAENVRPGANLAEFCSRMSLRLKAIQEMDKLRHQLARKGSQMDNAADQEAATELSSAAFTLQPPSNEQQDCIRQILLAGFGDRVAKKLPQPDPALLAKGLFPYQSHTTEELAFIHPSSGRQDQKSPVERDEKKMGLFGLLLTLRGEQAILIRHDCIVHVLLLLSM